MAKKRNRKKPQKQDNYLKICNSDIKAINWDGRKAKERLEHERFIKIHYVIPLYPFRFDTFWVNVWGRECKKIDLKDEVYDFTESDLDIICKTIGFEQLFDLPYVKAFLRNNCSVHIPNDCKWPDIVGELKLYLQEQSGIEVKKHPAETKQNRKTTIVAIIISLFIICIFVLSVRFIPLTLLTWLKNHPNSYGLQGSIIFLIPCLIVGLFKPQYRKWCWGVGAIAFIVLLLSLMGGPADSNVN